MKTRIGATLFFSFGVIGSALSAVPSVGIKTRISPNGRLEIASVKQSGAHAPWQLFSIRGLALGYTPPGFAPTSLAELLNSSFIKILDDVKSSGANTIRVYGLFPTSGPLLTRAVHFLDLCYELGIYVIPTVPTWSLGSNIAAIQSNASANSSFWKNHPALLAYCVANEFTLDPITFDQLQPLELMATIKEVESVAASIRLTDPSRVVMTSVHEIPDFQFLFNTDQQIAPQTWIEHFVSQAPSVGIWGIQLFRDGSLIPLDFKMADSAFSNVAWLITEFGSDSYHSVLQTHDQINQSKLLSKEWDWIHRIADGPNLDPTFNGSIIATHTDEWWKAGNNATLDVTSYPTTINYVAIPSIELIGYKGDFDGFRSEELLGVHSLDTSGGFTPKVAYSSIRSRFSNEALPTPTQEIEIVSRGYISGGGLLNGYTQVLVNGNTSSHGCGGCQIADNGPGLYIYEFSQRTGSISRVEHFNTLDPVFTTSAATYIASIPNGTLVAMAVADSFHLNLSLPFGPSTPHGKLVAQIKNSLGATLLTTSLPFRTAWSAIGIVGQPAPLAEAYDGTSGPVRAKAVIDLDLDLDGTPDVSDADLDGDSISNAAEMLVGTDPVNPIAQLYRVKLSVVAGTTIVRLAVEPGHPSADFSATQLDLSSFSFSLITPAAIDLTPLLLTGFSLTPTASGGVAFQSLSGFPTGLNLRLVARLDEMNGQTHIAELVIP